MESSDSAQDLPKLGDLVWAKIEGHMWWPSLVCNCPESLTYTKDGKGSSMIHVYFYNSPSSRGWVKAKFWRPFKGQEDEECKKGGLFFNTKKSVQNAIVSAEKAMSLTAEERLEDICKAEETKSRKRKSPEPTDDEEGTSSPAPVAKKANTKTEPIASTSFASTSQQIPEVKSKTKKNRPGPLSYKKSLGLVLDEQETFKVDDLHIPQAWKTPFVLVKALNPTSIGEQQKKDNETNQTGRGRRSKAPKRYVEEDEDDILDSDDDPGWGPEEDEVEEAEDDLDIDPVESDEDPGWKPSKKKGAKAPTPTPTKTFGVKSRKKAKTAAEPKTSQIVRARPKATSQPPKEIDPRNNPQPILLPPDAPPGVAPEIGDFLYEKSEYKDGNIPFLWKYKRSGLIQKFGQVKENGKILYESLLSFSDWWGCYAHKYEKIKVQVVFRYKQTEKVLILEMPDGSTPPGAQENSENSTSEAASSNTNGNTQEEEISSTTPELEFQNGKFVMDMKDQRNVDNFPIWKIESNILLKKFESVVKNGRVLHKAVKTYRGYKDIAKSYVSVKVKPVLEIQGDDYVEVKEESRPKLDARNDGSYDNNPLLRHFYVYLQVFLSQALEPGFLDEIKKTNDTTYSFPLGEIDKLIKQKSIQIERKVRWTPKIKSALMKCPYLREVPKPDAKRTCEAITESTESVEETVFMFGSEYDNDTLKQSGNSVPCQEFKVGKTAISLISHYHQLCHFKYNLYDRCLAKIKVIQETSKQELEITDIMDSCLGNKAWVLQNFEDFMQLVELV